uniref:Lipocalin n=1 Tax=Rhipicephalus sanguineus TaxID=34632 RepID=C9W1E4_RHISA
MFIITIAVLYGHALSCAGATDAIGTGSCTEDTPGENAINGYDFLKEGTRIDLIMTSLSDVFKHPDGGTVSCITVLTTEKNAETHEVTMVVSYKLGNDWEEFGHTYEFKQPQSGAHYVTMNNTQLNGAPSGTYTFTYVMGNCAVVTVEKFGARMNESNPEERTDESTNSKPHCIMWEKKGTSHATQKCCEKFFTANCEAKNRDYSYSPNTCGSPPH